MFPHTKPPAGTQINPLHPLSRGLVGCWLFNEGAGSLANDISGNKNHGRLTNMAPNVQGSGWGGSKFGGGLEFDGVDDYVNLGDKFDFAYDSPQTFEVWIKTTQTNEYVSILSKNDFTTPWSGWIFGIDGSGVNRIRFEYVTAGSTNHLRKVWKNVIYADGFCHHLVVSKGDATAANLHLYVDGVEHTDTVLIIDTLSSSLSTNINCQIGARDGTNWCLNGSIRSVNIYNGNKSAKDAKQLYEDPFCMMMKRPINRYYTAVAAGFQNRAAMMMMGLM